MTAWGRRSCWRSGRSDLQGQWLRRAFLCTIFGWCSVAAANVSYMLALSPDGSRVAVGQTMQRPQWRLFEGHFDRPLHSLQMPAGLYATGTFSYSADGSELLFVATKSSRSAAELATRSPTEVEAELSRPIDSLWRQRLAEGQALPKMVFEHQGISNAFSLVDGSIVFMGATKRLGLPSPDPLFGGPRRIFATYSWMVRSPDGRLAAINSKPYAFFSQASLIRDEAVFLIQEKRENGRPMRPREYVVDVTRLRTGADLSSLAGLGNTPSKYEPYVQCDWAGKTCARSTAYTKDGYLAHRLELIKDGRSCVVAGLPDRLEKFAISRNGSAIALITRPNPYRDDGYKLAHVTIDPGGCSGSRKFAALP